MPAPVLCNSLTALAVTGIYMVWRAYALTTTRREQTLRQRVAYMLWVMANQPE